MNGQPGHFGEVLAIGCEKGEVVMDGRRRDPNVVFWDGRALSRQGGLDPAILLGYGEVDGQEGASSYQAGHGGVLLSGFEGTFGAVTELAQGNGRKPNEVGGGYCLVSRRGTPENGNGAGRIQRKPTRRWHLRVRTPR